MPKDGEWLTINEIMKAYNMKKPRILYLTDRCNEIEDNKKCGRDRRFKYIAGKTFEYKNDRATPQSYGGLVGFDDDIESGSSQNVIPLTQTQIANLRYKEAQIQALEQKNERYHIAVRTEVLEEVMELAYERLKPLKDLTMSLNLSNEQLEALKEEWKKTFPTV